MAERLAFIAPMLPTLVDAPPKGDDWLSECKWDGYRTQLIMQEGVVRAFTRNGYDWTSRYKPIVDEATQLDCRSAIVDGEVIVAGANGAADFSALQAAVAGQAGKLTFVAFDLLHLNGRDLRQRPVEERRALLDPLIGVGGDYVHFSQTLPASPVEAFAAVEGAELEGIVCKRAGSRYVSGRTDLWVKVKSFMDSELELLGVQREPGKPIIALMGQPGTREYLGGAFVTFARPERDRFFEWVQANAGPRPKTMSEKEGVTWLKPGVTATVRHLRGEETLRHAKLVGYRG